GADQGGLDRGLLAVALEGDGHGLAGLAGADGGGQDGVRLDGVVVDPGDEVALLDAGGGGGAALADADDLGAGLAARAGLALDAEEAELHGEALGQALGGGEGGVDRDGEAHADVPGSLAVGEDGVVDADDAPLAVGEGAARVPRVDGG